MFNGPANLRKFHRRKEDKSYSKGSYFLCRKALRKGIEFLQDLYLSMRKLSNLSPSGNPSFFSVDLFSRHRGPMNITDAVAGNPRFHHIKTVLSQTVLDTPFWKTIVQSDRDTILVFHVDIFKACAVFAARSSVVKKPYRTSLTVSSSRLNTTRKQCRYPNFGRIFALRTSKLDMQQTLQNHKKKSRNNSSESSRDIISHSNQNLLHQRQWKPPF